MECCRRIIFYSWGLPCHRNSQKRTGRWLLPQFYFPDLSQVRLIYRTEFVSDILASHEFRKGENGGCARQSDTLLLEILRYWGKIPVLNM